MNKVIMYSTQVCPYCQMAERLLKSRGVENVEKVLIDKDPARREEMMSRTGRRTVPQVFIGETHVGGYDDLSALDRAGGLTPLLEAACSCLASGLEAASVVLAAASKRSSTKTSRFGDARGGRRAPHRSGTSWQHGVPK